MSAKPSSVPPAAAKQSNASKWPVFKKQLSNLDNIRTLLESADRLNVYLRNRNAYYRENRPEVGIVATSLSETLIPSKSIFKDC